MKLSTQGRHAIMSMLALALNDGEGALRLHSLARQQAISPSYLEQIFAKLRRAGLVEGVRGPHGGYRLGKTPARISIADILRALEADGRGSPNGPLPSGTATDVPLSLKIWEALGARLYAFLEGHTLAGLVNERRHQLPPRTYALGGTAGLIAGMFPPHSSASGDNAAGHPAPV